MSILMARCYPEEVWRVEDQWRRRGWTRAERDEEWSLGTSGGEGRGMLMKVDAWAQVDAMEVE